MLVGSLTYSSVLRVDNFKGGNRDNELAAKCRRIPDDLTRKIPRKDNKVVWRIVSQNGPIDDRNAGAWRELAYFLRRVVDDVVDGRRIEPARIQECVALG